jgi:hypothetical protein
MACNRDIFTLPFYRLQSPGELNIAFQPTTSAGLQTAF